MTLGGSVWRCFSSRLSSVSLQPRQGGVTFLLSGCQYNVISADRRPGRGLGRNQTLITRSYLHLLMWLCWYEQGKECEILSSSLLSFTVSCKRHSASAHLNCVVLQKELPLLPILGQTEPEALVRSSLQSSLLFQVKGMHHRTGSGY